MLVNSDVKIYNGETPITKVYQGTNVIYEAEEKPEYTQVKYLESNGTQYIDTGFYPTSTNVVIKVKFRHLTIGTTGRAVFGNYRGSGYYRTVATAHGGKWYFSGLNPSPYTYTLGNIHEVELKMNAPETESRTGTYEIWENDSLVGSGSNMGTYPSTTTTYKTMYLFTQHSSTQIEIPTANARIYYFQIYDNDELVRDFIPVLDPNNVPCMYEKVSQTYYYNAGTGTFLYEEIAPKTYTELDYIEATGTQYIDTRFVATNNTKVEIELSDVTGDDKPIYSASTEWNSAKYILTSQDNAFNWWYRNKNTFGNMSATGKISISTYRNTVILNGSTITSDNANRSITSLTNLYLFATPNGQRNPNSFKLHSCKIYDGGVLIRNLIPVLDKDNTPCLYDKLNDEYLYNAGTGTFLYG